jgi:hypothetical protein
MSVDTDSFDGPSAVWDEDVRRSRKDRCCSACHETIKRGDLYHSTRSLFDGSWTTIARCARCEAMYRFLGSVQGAGDVCDERLDCGHEWEDNFFGEPPLVVQALAFLTPSEAQLLLSKPWALQGREHVATGPIEAPERMIARLLGWTVTP